MNGTIRWAISAGADVVPWEAVVREDLPGGRRADEGVRLRFPVVVEPERTETHARRLGLGPAAPEEIRAADRAEGLRGAALRRVRGEKLLALQHADRLGPRASAHGAVAARDPLAELAVALRRPLERLSHLEANASAEAAALERFHRRTQYAASSQLSRRWRRSRRNIPAYAPSTSRWSYVSVRFINGRIAITSLPSSSWTTHGRLTSAYVPRMADCGWLMIGVPWNVPKLPGFVIVNVPPWTSSGRSFFVRARSARS